MNTIGPILILILCLSCIAGAESDIPKDFDEKLTPNIANDEKNVEISEINDEDLISDVLDEDVVDPTSDAVNEVESVGEIVDNSDEDFASDIISDIIDVDCTLIGPMEVWKGSTGNQVCAPDIPGATYAWTVNGEASTETSCCIDIATDTVGDVDSQW